MNHCDYCGKDRPDTTLVRRRTSSVTICVDCAEMLPSRLPHRQLLLLAGGESRGAVRFKSAEDAGRHLAKHAKVGGEITGSLIAALQSAPTEDERQEFERALQEETTRGIERERRLAERMDILCALRAKEPLLRQRRTQFFAMRENEELTPTGVHRFVQEISRLEDDVTTMRLRANLADRELTAG